MTDKEYRAWLIREIVTDRKAWCRRNKCDAEQLSKKSTRALEKVYDYAK